MSGEKTKFQVNNTIKLKSPPKDNYNKTKSPRRKFNSSKKIEKLNMKNVPRYLGTKIVSPKIGKMSPSEINNDNSIF